MSVHCVGRTFIFFLVFGREGFIIGASLLWESGCKAGEGGGLGVGGGVEGMCIGGEGRCEGK